MAVRIIKSEERLVWSDEESGGTFIYRRPLPAVRRAIRAKHTVNGVVDDDAVAQELLEHALLGWEGFVDENDQPLVYHPSLIPAIPELLVLKFAAHLYSISPELAQLKN